MYFIFPVLKGKCESCAAKPVPKGFPEVYYLTTMCVSVLFSI